MFQVTGRVFTVYLAEIFLTNYGKNAWMTDIVDTTRMHLMPSMNPDGYEKSVEGETLKPVLFFSFGIGRV